MLKNHYIRIGFYDNQGPKYSPNTERKIRQCQSVIENSAKLLFQYSELILHYQLILDNLEQKTYTLSTTESNKKTYYESRVKFMRNYLLENEIESKIEASFQKIEALHDEDKFRKDKPERFKFHTFA